MQRQRKVEELKRQGKGTPVTEESFREWQQQKKQKRALFIKKSVEAELRKKKGGKGLQVLTGKDLYEYKRDLFDTVDDDDDDIDIDVVVANGGGADAAEANGGVNGINDNNTAATEDFALAAKVQSDLFLEGGDVDDLDDLDDDD